MRQKNKDSEHYYSNTTPIRGNGRLERWNKDQIIQLKKELNNQILLGFLDTLADNADTWVGIEQMCETLGCSRDKLEGNLSYLTKFIKQHFAHDWWPVEIESDYEQSPGFRATYHMHPQIAQWWRE
jgi:hypothetical protein